MPPVTEYEVQRGDSLSVIARDELGDIDRWREIAMINGIAPPYTIEPGQVLELPVDEAEAEGMTAPERRDFDEGLTIRAEAPGAGVDWGDVAGWGLFAAAIGYALFGGGSTKPSRRRRR